MWLYTAFAAVILCGLWIGRAFIEGKKSSEHRFPKSEITQFDVGLPTHPWKPVAFSDFARKVSVDIVFVKENSNELAIFRYNAEADKYRKVQELTLDVAKIETVIPVDLERSGYNDLLVVHSEEGVKGMNMSILTNHQGFFRATRERLKSTTKTIPFVFDFWQNKTDDVLIQDPETGEFRLLYGGFKLPMHVRSVVAGDFMNTGSAQLVIESEPGSYGVWSFDQNGSVQCVQRFEGAVNYGELTAGDFDGDGFLDIAFPVSAGNETHLCFMFNSKDGFGSDHTCSNRSISMVVSVDNICPGARPQVGDLTLEGNPDICVTSEKDGKKFTQVFLNQNCMNCEGRGIQFMHRAQVDGVGGFVDLHEDGRLDLLTDQGSFISTLGEDTYFLKVTALNGLCLDSCSNGKRYPNPPPLATIQNGATVELLFTDKQGVKHKRVGVQRATVGLTTPYIVFGLGGEAHYVDEVSVSYASENHKWTWILPNSQVFLSNGQIRVFLLYNIQTFWVLFGAVVLLLTLGFFALMFARQEDEEDKKEADEMLPLF